MVDNMITKEELLEKIKEKEAEEIRAERESKAWNTGKYKSSSNAKISKIYLQALRREIKDLKEQLSLL